MTKKTILLVDDEEIVLKTLSKKLKAKGYDVMAVQNGYDAIANLKEKSYDLVITDLVMEGLDGFQVLKEAKAINPDLPVLILTSHGDMKSAVDALRLHADDYLPKPCNLEDLFFRISRCFKEYELSKKIIRQAREIEKTNIQLKAEISQRKMAKEALEKALAESKQREKEISALLEGSQKVLEYHKFDDAARAIYDICKGVIGSTTGYVALLSPDGTENIMLFLDSSGVECTVDPQLPMPIRGLRAEAYKYRKVVFDNDFSNSEWRALLPRGLTPLDNVMFAPLIIQENAVGLIGLANKPGGFTENDARIALAFGEIAAVALHNSQTLMSLEKSEEQTRLIVETALDAVVTMDGDGKITGWNRQAEAIFGWSRSEIIGQSLASTIVPPKYRKIHDRSLNRFLKTGKGQVFNKRLEMIALHHDGHEFPVELSISAPIKLGKSYVFCAFLHDITKRKLVEEEIKLLAKYPMENPNPVMRIKNDGAIQYANQASEPILEAFRCNLADCKPGTCLPDNWKKQVKNIYKSQKSKEVQLTHKGRVFSITLTPFSGTNYLYCYGRDITEQKRIEEELYQYHHHLEKLVKERTVGLAEANESLQQEIAERQRVERALRESERRLLEAQQIAQLGHWELDLVSNTLLWSNETYRIFDLQPDKFGASYEAFLNAVHPDDREFVNKAYTDSVKNKTNYNIIHRLLLKNGMIKYINEKCQTEYDKNGKPLRSLGTVLDITERKQAEEALEKALAEVEQLKNQLQAENIYLQDEIKLEHNFEQIISQSKGFNKVLNKVERVASTGSTVLILGETGTGKELVARAIHNLSTRKDRPLVKVNCAAIPPNLIESEFFGHEKGAFTGALAKKIGRFELADKGTIFLDEIGDLPLELQAKLLRILQEGEFERLGASETIKVDVRVIAATNHNLEKAIEAGYFRQDLFYRLNVFPIKIPPLRERKDDIPLLVNHFVQKYNTKLGKKIESIPLEIMASLQAYQWPGNVRELENIIERAVILSDNSTLELDEFADLSSARQEQSKKLKTLKENEQRLIQQALEECNWVIEGKRGAAAHLGIGASTLRLKIKKYGFRRPRNSL